MAADILIVDDEADIRDLVAGILQDEGYAARTARNSDEALLAIAFLFDQAAIHGARHALIVEDAKLVLARDAHLDIAAVQQDQLRRSLCARRALERHCRTKEAETGARLHIHHDGDVPLP